MKAHVICILYQKNLQVSAEILNFALDIIKDEREHDTYQR